jgi:hypothetical protein
MWQAKAKLVALQSDRAQSGGNRLPATTKPGATATVDMLMLSMHALPMLVATMHTYA